MFEQSVGATFSDLWYRVAQTRPRISPYARVVRQSHGLHVSYIVEEPASGRYYRVSEPAHFFLGLLDGRRTVDEAWETACAQLGDDAPTQKECIDLLAQMQLFGLLLGELPLAADMVYERKAQARRQRLRQRTGRWLFVSVPLFNPEPLLRRIEPLVRLIFSRWGAAAWVVVVGIGVFHVFANWRELGDPAQISWLMDTDSLVLMGVVFLGLRLFHELGHAAACKAMGGRSTEIGVILIVLLLPLPYCDATSAWRFPELWKRVLVSAAGVLVEFFIAAIAAVLWARWDQPALDAVCYRVMLISSVTTFFFNLNPLLRYDGYYILSDVAGVPNLAIRSRELWRYLVERFAFGLRNLTPPHVRGRGEAWVLGLFGAASTPYRVFIAVSILLIISSKWVTLGAALAVVAGVVWLGWPIVKGLAYLVGSPRLIGRRARAIMITSAVGVAAAALIGAAPVPAGAYAWGVVEPATQSPLRATESGFVTQVLAAPGQAVQAGEAVFVLENPDIRAEVELAAAQVERARANVDTSLSKSPAERRVAEQQLETALAFQRRAEARGMALTVRSPSNGRVAAAGGSPSDMQDLVDRYVARGTLLGYVVGDETLVIRTSVPDRLHAYVFPAGFDAADERSDPRAAVRVRGRAGEKFRASVTRVAAAGTRVLASPALGTTAGGHVLMDPTDPEGVRTLTPQFPVEVEPVERVDWLRPGMRARVRFAAEPEPLGSQVWRRIRRYFEVRMSR